jgi:hypothetical protein
MKATSADFFITSVAALEEAELLCTGTVVPPQALQQCLKLTRQSQVMPARFSLTVVCFLALDG